MANWQHDVAFDDCFTSEERAIRDGVQSFLATHTNNTLWLHAFEQAFFPDELIPHLGALGILGMTLPESVGGLNASPAAYGLVCQALEGSDSALRSFVSVQSSLCMFPIFKFGTPAQHKLYLPKMAKAELLGCFGLTEADSGSNPANMLTNARKVPNGWILNGSKMWITNATIAHLAIVWAKTEVGVRGFIVESSWPGVSTKLIKHKASLRASHTGELIFNEVFVPDENYLPGSEIGLKAALSCLTEARFGIAWGAIGAALDCFTVTLNYLKERKQFSRVLASHQLIQGDLADMFSEILKAQALNIRGANLKAAGKLTPQFVSVLKRNSAEVALKIARACRNLLGANGISLEYPVIRHLLNLEAVFTYEGTHNIHSLVIGQYLTGENAFDG